MVELINTALKTIPFEISISNKNNLYKVLVDKGDRKLAHEKIKQELLKVNKIFKESKLRPDKPKTTPTITFSDKTKLVVKPIGHSKNKGNAFEIEFIKNLQNWQRGETCTFPFERLQSVVPFDLKTCRITHDTSRRTRPITQTSDGFIIGSDGDIGSTIADVVLSSGNEKVYLSLKKGKNNTLKKGKNNTFCNIALPFFKEDEVMARNITNQQGLDFLDFLRIDPGLFCDVPNLRNCGTVDIKNYTHSVHPGFQKFLASAIGYGYIMIHQIGSDYLIKDWRTPNHLETATKVDSYRVRYAIGKSKSVELHFSTPMFIFNLNIRDKSGGSYERTFQAAYEYPKVLKKQN